MKNKIKASINKIKEALYPTLTLAVKNANTKCPIAYRFMRMNVGTMKVIAT